MVCFYFIQKSAYELRISDWSSDVCSSDRPEGAEGSGRQSLDLRLVGRRPARIIVGQPAAQIAVEHRIRRRVVEVVAGEIADTQPLDRRGVPARHRQLARGEPHRSEERRVGKEWGSRGRSRWWP